MSPNSTFSARLLEDGARGARTYPPASAALVSLYFLALPARLQSQCPDPATVFTSMNPVNESPSGGCYDFYDCFVNHSNIATYGRRASALLQKVLASVAPAVL